MGAEKGNISQNKIACISSFAFLLLFFDDFYLPPKYASCRRGYILLKYLWPEVHFI
jgi:hypothetical protein